MTTGASPKWRKGCKYYIPYARAIIRAGGQPVALGNRRRGRIEDCDGLLVTGGDDVHPRHYDRRPGDENLTFDELKIKYSMLLQEPRDAYELPLVTQALESGIPVLAICRGIQLVNVVMGGGLIPDLQVCNGNSVAHKSGIVGVPALHNVKIEPDSMIGRLIPGPTLLVNSYHHQGMCKEDIAPGLRVTAIASDGVVEAVEGRNHPWLVAVQWHPERKKDGLIHEVCMPIFEEFVRASTKR